MPVNIDFRRGNKKLLSEIGTISVDDWHMLQSLQLEPGDYYPAAASLRNGGMEPCVMFIKKDSVARQFQFSRRGFFKDFYMFDDEVMIEAESVARVFRSPFRTPPDIFGRIHKNGPTHMFGYGLKLKLRDGTEFMHTSGDFIEFCSVPEGYTTDDIVDFEVAEWDRVRDLPLRLEAPHFKWCIFKERT